MKMSKEAFDGTTPFTFFESTVRRYEEQAKEMEKRRDNPVKPRRR